MVVLKDGRLVFVLAALMDDKKDGPTGGGLVDCLAELTAALMATQMVDGMVDQKVEMTADRKVHQ